uniref:Uncharacterized protein n=1 Tax=Arundo donax TaxID=35708 RepID=A0A0A8YW18_ARUDO
MKPSSAPSPVLQRRAAARHQLPFYCQFGVLDAI